MRSYAKINPGLDILNEREDGYHNIDTIFQRINLYDEIDFEISDKTEIISYDFLPALEDNLMFKAKVLLENYTGKSLPFKARVKKNIPIAAGLAGGSGNAAATLSALNELYNLNLSKDILMEIGKSAGADIPFFVSGFSSARAKGIGDILFPFSVNKDYEVFLVKPDLEIFTKDVYAGISSQNYGKIDIDGIERVYRKGGVWSEKINIMEDFVFEKYPELIEIKSFLYEMGASMAFMSGSGPTVVGIFEQGFGDFNMFESFYENFWTLRTRFI